MLFLIAIEPAGAQSSGYTTLNVKSRVQLEIPDHWKINDAEHRKRVKENSENITGVTPQHIASLSVHSFPPPSRNLVRVSFLKLEPSITQDEIRREVQADRQEVIRGIADSFTEEHPAMLAAFAKMGLREVGRASFAVEVVGSQTALVIRYGRTSTFDPAQTMRVTQYHIPLGDEKALISLSYLDGDEDAKAAHDRIKSSIIVR